MYAFEFVKPATLAAAREALQAEDAQLLGGGQTLIPALRARLARPSVLVSLGAIPDLRHVSRDGGTLRIGGATSHAQVARDAAAHYPALASLAARIGDPAVRNRGTIGGSLANDDPSACWPAGALASGATIVTDAREIAADDFFQGLFTTALDPGEIITEVRFPVPERARYEKFIQPASRFPLVAVFVAKYPGGVRVAVTGASDAGVFRWTEAEAALSADFSAAAVKSLALPEDNMIGDLWGTPAYRAHLAAVLAARATAAAA